MNRLPTFQEFLQNNRGYLNEAVKKRKRSKSKTDTIEKNRVAMPCFITSDDNNMFGEKLATVLDYIFVNKNVYWLSFYRDIIDSRRDNMFKKTRNDTLYR